MLLHFRRDRKFTRYHSTSWFSMPSLAHPNVCPPPYTVGSRPVLHRKASENPFPSTGSSGASSLSASTASHQPAALCIPLADTLPFQQPLLLIIHLIYPFVHILSGLVEAKHNSSTSAIYVQGVILAKTLIFFIFKRKPMFSSTPWNTPINF